MVKGNRAKLPRLKALMVAVHAAWGTVAWALPQDATVVNGQVVITQPAAGSMRINASNGAIINWRQFSIGAGESTRFIQPSATSAVLNRVVGSEASQLLGQLQSNGQVFLINPNGIVIGAGARIDTNSFIASTLDIADADFLAGKLRFFERGTAGRIDNGGLITAGPGGRIFLIAPDIQNSGILHAPDGQILLAAGRKLEITSMDLDGIRFEIQAPTDSVLNLGQLLAENGAIGAFAGTLRHSGTAQANRLALDADGGIVLAGSHNLTLDAGSITRADGARGGNIVLQSAQGTTRVAGTVSAQGSAGQGGDIRVLGERVSLQAGATLDASGSLGGGQILVGGDYQGKNAAVQNAERVSVAEGTTLRADATAQGDGGRIIVWADENTRFQGHVSAQGAGQDGDGGFAEVSGKQNLEFAGTANLGAALGQSGTLLLDPLDIIISSTSGLLPSVVDEFTDFPFNVVTVSPKTLAGLQGNVMLQANRDIYIKDELKLTAAGAGVTMLAGGATYTDGAIYNNGGIITVGGAVTLRANGLYGRGGITTAGGAVDVLTTGTLSYGGVMDGIKYGVIDTGNGSVTLASANGSVNSANVLAGSGNITVTASDNGSTNSIGIFGGSYVTTGVSTFTALGTNGRISGVNVHAGTATLSAERDVNAVVQVGDRVNASSSTGSVTLSADGDTPLRVGTVSARNSVSLVSNHGMAMASQGQVSAAAFNLFVGGSSVAAGAADAPLLFATNSAAVQPTIAVYGATAPVHIGLGASTVLGSLYLEGSVAGLGGSSLTGGANLAGAAFSVGAGMLDFSLATTSGLAGGLTVSVRDGGIHATNLSLPGAAAVLAPQGGVVLDAFTGGSLVISARGDVSIGSAQTTGAGGIRVDARQCSTSAFACTAANNITAGTLSTSGSGSIGLYTYDNGSISVSSLAAAGDVAIAAGRVFNTSSFTSQATTNGISLGTVVGGRDVDVNNVGNGNVTIGSLQATRSVDIAAGNYYQPVAFGPSAQTSNQITVQNVGNAATGDYTIYNNGTGGIALGGTIDRTASGSVYLQTANGSVSSSGDIAARYYLSVNAGQGSVSLGNATSAETGIDIYAGSSVLVGNLVAGSPSSSGSVTVQAGADLRFASIQSTGANSNSGSVYLAAYGGAVRTTLDNPGMDIVASGDVSLYAFDTAAGSIGNSAFTNPLNIQAGSNAIVTLLAGKDIGATSKAVTVDTTGTIDVTSYGGQFHVAATDGTTERAVASIRLSASAAGVGAGQSSTFDSANQDVVASSNGSALTLGDLVQTTGTLNEFAFQALGGGLNFGNVNLATTGFDKLALASQGPLIQTTGNILAGNLRLDAGGGDVTVGGTITANSAEIASPSRNNILYIRGGNIATASLQAQSIDVLGNGTVAINGTVNSTGTQRGFANGAYDYDVRTYVTDELKLVAGGNLTTAGAVTSATSSILTAGGSVNVAGGAGAVSGGAFGNFYYHDKVQMTAGAAPGGTIAAGALSALDVTLQAYGVTVGTINANQATSVTGNTLQTGAITSGSSAILTGSSLATGSITAPNIRLTGDTWATGNLTASSSLQITASAGYAPSGIALNSGNVQITAQGNIAIGSASNSSLTSPNVTLSSALGNVSAELTGTSRLNLSSGKGFLVTTDTWLTNLDVTAYWDKATDTVGGSVGASVVYGANLQTFSLGFAGPLVLRVDADPSAAAGRTWNFSYNDYSALAVVASPTPSANDNVALQMDHAGTGSFYIYFGSDTVFGSSTVNLGTPSAVGGTLSLNTGGTVQLNSVQTHGGSLYAVSRSGDILVGSIVTSAENFGGDVSLYSYNGSIERDGGSSHLIETAALCTLCSPSGPRISGDITLSAALNVGANGAIPVAQVGYLSIEAHDTINVDVTAGSPVGLSITTAGSGTGAVSVNNSTFTGLSITRGGGNLILGALNPGFIADFALTATDGNLYVAGDIANVGNLRLNAGYGYNQTGDLIFLANGGPRSVTSQSHNLFAGRDILIGAGAGAGDNVVVAALGGTLDAELTAGRDLLVAGNGGSAVLSHAATNYTQRLSAGRNLAVVGGSGGLSGASASVTSAGYQTFGVGNDFLIQGGASDGAAALVQAAFNQSDAGVAMRNLSVVGGGNNAQAALVAGASQSFTNIQGNLTVAGGAGTNALAKIESTNGSQALGNSNGATIDQVLVQGGSGVGASAAIRSLSTSSVAQSVHSDGDILVVGGSATGSDAEIASAAGSQTVGSNFTRFSNATQNIVVQGGAGGSARIRANGTQTLEAGDNIVVQGGSGSGTYAVVETTGAQTVGRSEIQTFFNNYVDPTNNITVQGGGGDNAFAAIRTTATNASTQTLRAGGDIAVLGGAGAGAYGEVSSTATGLQSIGTSSTSNNDPTRNIRVQAGAGGIARIQAQGSQSILLGGDLTVQGGTGAGMTASIESVAGAQTIGNTSTSFNDSTGSITVAGGSAADAAAWVRARTNQTLNAGNKIALGGGSAAGTFADVSTGTGFQTINNASGGDLNTATNTFDRGVTLTGGTFAFSYARFMAGSSQQLTTTGDVVLRGGTGNQSGALFDANFGQYVSAAGRVDITGGSGASMGGNQTGFENHTSGGQTIQAGGDIVVTAGTTGSYTSITNSGSGAQLISSSTGSVSVVAPASNPNADGFVSIESGTGGQTLYLPNGSLTVDNAGALAAYISSDGTQSITAKSMLISVSSPYSLGGVGPVAVVSAEGDQTINLLGDRATVGTATLVVRNMSDVAGSLAALYSGGNLSILMDYNAAGLVQIGDINGLGRAFISADKELTMVAGQLLLQGGMNAAADALLLSAQADPTDGIMVLSTLYGPVELKGGALGGAYIDPPELYITSNGSVLLQAGSGPGADANITAGLFQLAATTGDLTLKTSTSSPATATITAGSFYYVGPGGVYLINGTITAPDGGSINVPLQCVNCDTNIFGPVQVTAYVPPPVDYSALVAGDVTALAQLGGGIFEALFDDEGNLVFSRRRLSQCF